MENPPVTQALSQPSLLDPSLEPFSRFPQLELWMQKILVTNAAWQMPPSSKEMIPKYIMPWITLVGVVLIFFASFIGGALTLLLAPLAILVAPVRFLGDLLLMLARGAELALMAASIPGLFARTKRGWVFMFYAELLGVVWSVASFSLVGLLVNALGFYIIFQIKAAYR
ncbi:MAG: hypothetical protein H6715_05680 [Myxococcales bacterium]|nr:hypothetical protein [Myxococcales bacterium]MCB9707909.1 hypothetical protein [Myxococcales bacterium]